MKCPWWFTVTSKDLKAQFLTAQGMVNKWHMIMRSDVDYVLTGADDDLRELFDKIVADERPHEQKAGVVR